MVNPSGESKPLDDAQEPQEPLRLLLRFPPSKNTGVVRSDWGASIE